ncbi:MAG TPA: hypothetical protein VME46_19440 [Acidimicrobiales bacterium]|nr:hypothetical protein [Acidimicrobiales bacterium]
MDVPLIALGRPSHTGHALVVAGALAATLAAGLAAVLPAPVAAASTPPAGSLAAVSCAGTTFCVAVGSSSTATGPRVALVEKWDGHKWTKMTLTAPAGSSGSALFGVSCPSTTTCTAVGEMATGHTSSAALVERWDGSGWQRQSVPKEAGATSVVLFSVSCVTSSSCASVGDYYTTSGYSALAATYHGGDWQLVTVPVPARGTPSALDGVSCRPTSCTVVGYYFNRRVSNYSLPLAERLTAANAVAEDVPQPAGVTKGGQLQAVSCPAASACEAVGIGSTGSGSAALAYRWSAGGWSDQTLPKTPASLDGVSCPTLAVCVATGQTETTPSSTLAYRWAGSKWEAQPTTNPPSPTDRVLAALSCPSTSDCVAVGSYFAGSSQHSWSELWDGTKWETEATAAG